MPHTKRYKKYQPGRSSIYDLSKNICPTTRRNIPWLYALFLDGSRSPRVASPAPKASRRCMGRLRTAMPPWSSCWSLRGPRWTRPTKNAVAPEGFSGRFGSGSDEVMKGFVHWQGIFVLCFGMLSGTCCLRCHVLSVLGNGARFWWDVDDMFVVRWG